MRNLNIVLQNLQKEGAYNFLLWIWATVQNVVANLTRRNYFEIPKYIMEIRRTFLLEAGQKWMETPEPYSLF